MPVDMDREVWEMGKKQSQIIMQLGALDKAIRRSHERIDKVNETLRLMSARDEVHESRVSMVQEAVAEFQVTLSEVRKTLKLLKKMLSGAAVLVGLFGALVGVLGAEVFPLILKHAMAVIGF